MHDKSQYPDLYARSMRDPEGFWADAARDIDWIEPAKKVFDASQGLYGRWFAGAVVNTCYNALDRHVANGRAEQLALIHDSPLTNSVTTFTYAQMLHEVKTFAAILLGETLTLANVGFALAVIATVALGRRMQVRR